MSSLGIETSRLLKSGAADGNDNWIPIPLLIDSRLNVGSSSSGAEVLSRMFSTAAVSNEGRRRIGDIRASNVVARKSIKISLRGAGMRIRNSGSDVNPGVLEICD